MQCLPLSLLHGGMAQSMLFTRSPSTEPVTVSESVYCLFRVLGLFFPYMCYTSSVLAGKPV